MSDNQFDNCTSITPDCPVWATTYGYYPTIPGNVILLAIFGICAITNIGLAIFYRIWAFGIVVSVACLMETVGYVGRIMMNNNPWDDNAFLMQVVCLIVAPSFLAAGIYLTLKHMVNAVGPEHSRLPPRWYTWIFIGADALSILVQSIGGGIASSADDKDSVDLGNNLMIAGVAIQVATMALCVILAIDFGLRVWKHKRLSGIHGSLGQYTTTRRFYVYLVATGFAFLFVFIRCIYRLPEMAGGWGNDLMRHEAEFLVLDGTMIALASILLTVAYPGYFFPAMRQQAKKQKNVNMKEHGPVVTEYAPLAPNNNDGYESSMALMPQARSDY